MTDFMMDEGIDEPPAGAETLLDSVEIKYEQFHPGQKVIIQGLQVWRKHAAKPQSS